MLKNLLQMSLKYTKSHNSLSGYRHSMEELLKNHKLQHKDSLLGRHNYHLGSLEHIVYLLDLQMEGRLNKDFNKVLFHCCHIN